MNRMENKTQKNRKCENVVKISERLKLVASFVTEGSRVADIGTDHGYVPVYLAQTGKIVSALAMDVRKGPLERAREHVREYEIQAGEHAVPITLRLSDGLKELKAGEADTVIIAGMGGELVMRILTEGRELWETIENWILSPQSDLDKVRRFLEENGFSICKEAMLKEEGKFYTVMKVCRGNMEPQSETERRFGLSLLKEKNPVLREYLQQERRRIEGILASFAPKDGESFSLTAGQEKARETLLEDLKYLKEAEDEVQ